MMQHRKTSIALCIIVAAVLGGGWLLHADLAAIHDTAASETLYEPGSEGRANRIASVERRWSERIAEKESDAVYADFLATYKDASPNRQHQYAHVFGKLLYEKERLDGITVCDQNFAFGCFHEFLGQAMHEHGLSIVEDLNTKCIEVLDEQALGCQHGIGHGIQTTLGYDYDALQKALAMCDELPVSDPIGGCKGGVFMEYNFRTMLSDTLSFRSYEDKNSVYYPCDALAAKHREACYYWQPQWWQSAFETMTVKDFEQLGVWCGDLENNTYRRQCYMGIGNNAAGIVGWKVDTMQELCAGMPTSEGRDYCRVSAAGAFRATLSDKSVAARLCQDVEIQSEAECLREAQLPDDKKENAAR